MSKFQIVKELSLSFLGGGWENAYIKLNSFTISETQELAKQGKNFTDQKDPEQQVKATDLLLKLLGNKLIEGKGFNGKELVEIKKEDLKDLPPSILPEIMSALSGTIEKKS